MLPPCDRTTAEAISACLEERRGEERRERTERPGGERRKRGQSEVDGVVVIQWSLVTEIRTVLMEAGFFFLC